MSTPQMPALDDPKIQWKEATSRNGASYRIGVMPIEGANKKEGDVVGEGTRIKGTVRAKADFEIGVDWTVDDTWHTTSDDFQATTGITDYRLSQNTDTYRIYDYTLSFNTKESYDYNFEDQTGDYYECNVYDTDPGHHVSYNSEQPTIIKVYGS